MLLRAGLPSTWWLMAGQHWCTMRNALPRGPDAPAAYEARHGTPFPGMRIPFGAEISFHPPEEKEKGEKDEEGGGSMGEEDFKDL